MLPTPTTRALLCDSAEHTERASQEALAVENPPANAGRCKTWLQPLRWEDPLEEGVATHSSILAWRIPWTEELGRLQSMGLHMVRHVQLSPHGHAKI